MANLKLHSNHDQSIDDVLGYIQGDVVELDCQEDYKGQIDGNHEMLLAKVQAGMDIYGANTGFGSSSKNRFSDSLMAELQKNLYSYHGCGVGAYLAEDVSAAVLLIRTHCLAQGYSGVSYGLLKHLQFMLKHRVLPAIPAMGSVGASGDLTPLSYLAAAMAGERKVYFNGQIEKVSEVYRKLDRAPYAFKPREALAVMNGTSVMTGIMVVAIKRLRRLGQIACDATGLMVELLQGRSAAYLAETHKVKRHSGQRQVAANILSFIHNKDDRLYNNSDGSIQDRYSLRCSPHIIGAFLDTLSWSEKWVEDELNSVSDNPIFTNDQVLNGGHFYGGHIAQAADSLKIALANTMNLVDRQMALLMEWSESHLSENLVLRSSLGEKACLNHGFKGVQITMSALTAELVKAATPMSIFSRPTETSNQDVVSMGTIAARDLYTMCGLAESAQAIMLMALFQGFQVRHDLGKGVTLNQKAKDLLELIGENFEVVREDRPIDADIQAVAQQFFS